ncbi:MAG: tRNA (cytidine(34)-2'-O)-methyltransferase [Phycisphaerales bacterium]|nr:tRNA (cytidine(34)-2'-O)-methyltransferase [Phycisphaerales bacterium]
MLHLVLYTPEIPNNTGTIGRTAMAIGARLHLIEPLGFDLSEKAVRRAGLDYWADLDWKQHANWQAFMDAEQPERLLALTARAQRSLWDATIEDDTYLLFGRESDGLPQAVLNAVRGQCGEAAIVGLPQVEGVRSLNLACAATAAAYEAWRQILAR